MLAYLFFHRPAPGVDVADYEAAMRRFHAALGKAGVSQFVSSRTYRVGGMYCDWYLVESSAALDAMNEAAVSGARLPLHDAVARRAVDGAGKLLKLTAGRADPDRPFETRFSKPAGMTYRELYERLKPWTDRDGSSLWRRMMVLGPPPEFCLLSASSVALPSQMQPAVLAREPV